MGDKFSSQKYVFMKKSSAFSISFYNKLSWIKKHLFSVSMGKVFIKLQFVSCLYKLQSSERARNVLDYTCM